MELERFKLKCQCGSILTALATSVGKKAKCRHCEHVFVVPSAAPKISPAPKPPKTPAVKRPCESCNRDMGIGTLVCMNCGYHTKLKRKLDTEGVKPNLGDTAISWLAGMTGAIAIIGVSSMYLPRLNGPQFLILYFSLFCFCALATILAKP